MNLSASSSRRLRICSHQTRLRVERLEDRCVLAAVHPLVVDHPGPEPGNLPGVGPIESRPLMVAYNSVALEDSEVIPPSDYDGVAKLLVTTSTGQVFGCSGSLLNDNDPGADYVLTAAHCVSDGSGNPIAHRVDLSWRDGTITAVADDEQVGGVDPDGDDVFVHSGWNGNFLLGNDLAVLQIPPISTADLPADVRYDLYRGTGTPELRQVFTKAGYGRPGIGSRGYDPSGGFGTLRVGENRFDDTYGLSSETRAEQRMLAYDFDSGRLINDAIGLLFGIRDRGLGVREAFPAPGDSGGPAFLGGKIAGITSFLLSVALVDAVPGANASFGEIGFDTRVARFADWIDGLTSPDTTPPLRESLGLAAATADLTRLGRTTVPDPSGNSVILFVPDLNDTGADVGPPGWIVPKAGRPRRKATAMRAEGTSSFNAWDGWMLASLTPEPSARFRVRV